MRKLLSVGRYAKRRARKSRETVFVVFVACASSKSKHQSFAKDSNDLLYTKITIRFGTHAVV